MALNASEFLRRFCQHVLPRGFVRIRHFGYLASAHRTALLALARLQLAGQPRPDPHVAISQLAAWRCPRCGANMSIGPNLTAQQLAFPMQTIRHLMIPTQSNGSQTCAGTSSHSYVRITKLPTPTRFLAARRSRNYPFHPSPPRIATFPAPHLQTLPSTHRRRISPPAP